MVLKQKRSGERQVALFLLGVLLLFPPVLQIFNRADKVLGIPMLYLYVFIVWAALIGFTLLITRRMRLDDQAGLGSSSITGDDATRPSPISMTDVPGDA